MVTKQYLLARLSVIATEFQCPELSMAKLESWIHKGLLPPAKASGVQRGQNPNWYYPDDALENGKELLRLEAQGASRVAQLRIGLAIAGAKVDQASLREDLASEFERWVKRQRRGSWKNFRGTDATTSAPDVSAGDHRRLSEIDPELAQADLSLRSSEAIGLLSSAFFGTSETKRPRSAASTLPFKDLTLANRLLPLSLRSELEQILKNSMALLSGTMGSEEETDNAGVARIRNTDLATIEKALDFYRLVLGHLDKMAVKHPRLNGKLFGVSPARIALSLRHYSWQPIILSFILMVAPALPIIDETEPPES